MKKILLIVIIILITVTINIFGQSAIDIAKNCLPSTVFITMEDEHHQPLAIGSGFIVGEGKIITNLHVIEGAKFGYVLLIEDDTKHKIDGYFKIDKANDLALLSVPTVSGKVLPIFDGDYPEIGERIYAIGNPKGLSGTISEGIVSGLRSEGESKLIQITAPISPGSSGGPVINNSGEVVGVAVGTITSGQNLNFAIPSSFIRILIENQNSLMSELDIKEEIKLDEELVNINSALEIINLINNSTIFRFNVINKLPYLIKNIRILIIKYRTTGNPVDYFEDIYFEDGIRPLLAREINYNWDDYINDKSLRVFKNTSQYKWEIRIIDFDIIRD